MTPSDSCSQLVGAHTMPDVWPSEDLEYSARCPVCGGLERSLLHDHLTDRVFYCAPGEWALYTCRNCGSAYLDPRPTPASIGRAYSSYYTHAGRERAADNALSGLRRMRRALANGYRNSRFGTHLEPSTPLGVPFARLVPYARRSLDIAVRCIPKPQRGARLLDVGAGSGDFLKLAQMLGWSAQGVDPDPSAAAVCRMQNLDVRVGGIDQFATEVGCFDYITMSHVIEHVHNPRGVLTVALDLLKRGGTLYIDTPNIASFGRKIYRDAWRGLEPPRHLVLFNWSSLQYLLRDIGFSCIRRWPRANVYAQLSAKSRALERRRDPYSERTSMLDRVTGFMLAMRMPFNYADSEFVTLTASKPLEKV